jgi:O-antigen ligase
VIAAVCITCLISGNPRGFRVSIWLIPAAVLIVLSFSRNHLLGLAVAVLFALLAFRSARSVVAAVWAASIVVLVGVLIQLGAANVFAGLPATDYVAAQAHGYVERVIDGLKPENQAIDSSVQYRRKETATLTKKISESPLTGHGFGYAYKAPSGPPGSFFRESAPYYAHNFYLWLLLKAGWLGMVIFVWMAFVPLARILFKPASTLQVATASAAVGLLAISVFAPIPNDSPGAPLLGAVLGIAVALGASRTTEPLIRVSANEDVRAKVAVT